MLTIDEVKEGLPETLRSAVSQDLVDKLNQISADPEAAAAIRDTFVSYGHVLKDGRFKIEDYVNAAAYVSYRMMGFNTQESYSRTFPAKYQALTLRGATVKEISSYVSMYNRNKLVNLLYEQVLIPVSVLFQDVFHDAVREQAKIMVGAKSEMVRMQAANSLLTHLKPPDKKQIDLEITTPGMNGLDQLKDLLTAVATRQIELIESGATTREVAHQKLGQPMMQPDMKTAAKYPSLIDVTPNQAT